MCLVRLEAVLGDASAIEAVFPRELEYLGVLHPRSMAADEQFTSAAL